MAITTLLAEDIDKIAKHFGTHDIVKSRVVTDLKTASGTKRKDNLVKKFGVDLGEEGTIEEANEISDDEDEDKGDNELEQGPL